MIGAIHAILRCSYLSVVLAPDALDNSTDEPRIRHRRHYDRPTCRVSHFCRGTVAAIRVAAVDCCEYPEDRHQSSSLASQNAAGLPTVLLSITSSARRPRRNHALAYAAQPARQKEIDLLRGRGMLKRQLCLLWLRGRVCARHRIAWRARED